MLVGSYPWSSKADLRKFYLFKRAEPDLSKALFSFGLVFSRKFSPTGMRSGSFLLNLFDLTKVLAESVLERPISENRWSFLA